MEKVYILTIEDICEFDYQSHETLVFATMEKAKEHLQKCKTSFLLNLAEDSQDNIEESETYFCWYCDGFFKDNHYILKIEQKEIL